MFPKHRGRVFVAEKTPLQDEPGPLGVWRDPEIDKKIQKAQDICSKNPGVCFLLKTKTCGMRLDHGVVVSRIHMAICGHTYLYRAIVYHYFATICYKLLLFGASLPLFAAICISSAAIRRYLPLFCRYLSAMLMVFAAIFRYLPLCSDNSA